MKVTRFLYFEINYTSFKKTRKKKVEKLKWEW